MIKTICIFFLIEILTATVRRGFTQELIDKLFEFFLAPQYKTPVSLHLPFFFIPLC